MDPVRSSPDGLANIAIDLIKGLARCLQFMLKTA